MIQLILQIQLLQPLKRLSLIFLIQIIVHQFGPVGELLWGVSIILWNLLVLFLLAATGLHKAVRQLDIGVTHNQRRIQFFKSQLLRLFIL